ncbi:PolC-type DNA polymerase III [Schaalia suimastitidis]|uniref:3'-5' exonuclease n=1 Tax=Schaalia suimastitidis TaxID=121163 RepID=UPI0004130968|nr:3'-5' exonuclease [Schaalia suimastitidis]
MTLRHYSSSQRVSADTLRHTRATSCAHAPTRTTADEQRWLIFDVETTGLSARDEITEIAALIIDNNAVSSSFHTLCHPGRPIPTIVTRITGIDEALVANAPSVPHAMGALHHWLENEAGISDYPPIFVAHNVPFDQGFLSRAAKRSGVAWPSLPTMDTLELSRILLPKPRVANHRLATLAQYFSFPGTQEHRALADTYMTWHVLRHLLALQRDSQQGTYR